MRQRKWYCGTNQRKLEKIAPRCATHLQFCVLSRQIKHGNTDTGLGTHHFGFGAAADKLADLRMAGCAHDQQINLHAIQFIRDDLWRLLRGPSREATVLMRVLNPFPVFLKDKPFALETFFKSSIDFAHG